jgi:hypothetical protein
MKRVMMDKVDKKWQELIESSYRKIPDLKYHIHHIPHSSKYIVASFMPDVNISFR